MKNIINIFTSSIDHIIIQILEAFFSCSVAATRGQHYWSSIMVSLHLPDINSRTEKHKPLACLQSRSCHCCSLLINKYILAWMSTNIKRWEHNPIFENIDILCVDIPIDSSPQYWGQCLKDGWSLQRENCMAGHWSNLLEMSFLKEDKSNISIENSPFKCLWWFHVMLTVNK